MPVWLLISLFSWKTIQCMQTRARGIPLNLRIFNLRIINSRIFNLRLFNLRIFNLRIFNSRICNCSEESRTMQYGRVDLRILQKLRWGTETGKMYRANFDFHSSSPRLSNSHRIYSNCMTPLFIATAYFQSEKYMHQLIQTPH